MKSKLYLSTVFVIVVCSMSLPSCFGQQMRRDIEILGWDQLNLLVSSTNVPNVNLFVARFRPKKMAKETSEVFLLQQKDFGEGQSIQVKIKGEVLGIRIKLLRDPSCDAEIGKFSSKIIDRTDSGKIETRTESRIEWLTTSINIPASRELPCYIVKGNGDSQILNSSDE